MTLGIPTDGTESNDFATIPDVSIDAIASRVSPQQVATGTMRGTQTIMGSDTSKITLGSVGTTNQLAEAQYDANGKIVSQLGQQADGSSSLKFFDANGVGVAEFGRFADGSTALKVAKPNIEVSTATNSQLIFNSGQDALKVVKSGTTSIVSTGTNPTRLTIPHNLGVVPAYLIYWQVPNAVAWGALDATSQGKYIQAPTVLYDSTVAIAAMFTPTVDNTNLYITERDIYRDGSTINISYYLMQETATVT